MKILMVLTSHDQLGGTDRKTGFWLEKFAALYFVFRDTGVEMTFALPKGGQPPLDPKSGDPDPQTETTWRFKNDNKVQAALTGTVKFSTISAVDYDALFYPSGHEPFWDLVEDPQSISLIKTMYAAGKPVAAVCHAPGVLCHAKAPDDSPLVRDKPVTDFANSEEATIGLMEVVLFLVEDMSKKNGGKYSKGSDWQSYVVATASLITEQNPVSSETAARALLSRLNMT